MTNDGARLPIEFGLQFDPIRYRAAARRKLNAHSVCSPPQPAFFANGLYAGAVGVEPGDDDGAGQLSRSHESTVYMRSGTSIPRRPNTSSSSRKVSCAMRSRDARRAISDSLRMWQAP